MNIFLVWEVIPCTLVDRDQHSHKLLFFLTQHCIPEDCIWLDINIRTTNLMSWNCISRYTRHIIYVTLLKGGSVLESTKNILNTRSANIYFLGMNLSFLANLSS